MFGTEVSATEVLINIGFRGKVEGDRGAISVSAREFVTKDRRIGGHFMPLYNVYLPKLYQGWLYTLYVAYGVLLGYSYTELKFTFVKVLVYAPLLIRCLSFLFTTP